MPSGPAAWPAPTPFLRFLSPPSTAHLFGLSQLHLQETTSHPRPLDEPSRRHLDDHTGARPRSPKIDARWFLLNPNRPYRSFFRHLGALAVHEGGGHTQFGDDFRLAVGRLARLNTALCPAIQLLLEATTSSATPTGIAKLDRRR